MAAKGLTRVALLIYSGERALGLPKNPNGPSAWLVHEVVVKFTVGVPVKGKHVIR